MEKYYDSHCHVFIQKETLNLRLIIQIIFSLPDILKKEKIESVSSFDDVKEKKNQLKRIVNFLKVGLSNTEQKVYDKMQDVYNKNFSIVPLMFDLECVFVRNRSGEEMNVEIDMASLQDQYKKIVDAFHAHHNKNINTAVKLINTTSIYIIPSDATPDIQEYRQLLQESISLFETVKVENFVNQDFSATLKNNFELQLEDITKLKNENDGMVFPFIAIDPRRKGIIDRYINEIYPQKIFTGVKLYCPNGYSPTDDDLMKEGGLYDFCQKNNIPITAHHSHSGFATPLRKVEIFGDIYKNNKVKAVHGEVKLKKAFADDWIIDRAEKLNHPELWKLVLTKYPDLKLNLAHFGSGSIKWQGTLKTMLNNYRNLYTDLSCWTKKGELQKFKDDIFLQESDNFRTKILYGSDFYLDLLFIDSFKEYVNNFFFQPDSVFTKEEFTQIAITNANKFLFSK